VDISKYFRNSAPATAASVASDLWTPGIAATNYSSSDQYQAAILEQYKLYVEMADRVSARRGLANTFFLTLNTAVFTTIGVFWKDRPHVSQWLLAIPLVILLVQCAAWFWMLRSYRQLNTGKWAVVGALEERLPASPYWKAEWTALGKGQDPARYWPVTHVEQVVPWIFAAAYFAAVVAVIAS
jgi:hypothetical protein